MWDLQKSLPLKWIVSSTKNRGVMWAEQNKQRERAWNTGLPLLELVREHSHALEFTTTMHTTQIKINFGIITIMVIATCTSKVSSEVDMIYEAAAPAAAHPLLGYDNVKPEQRVGYCL